MNPPFIISASRRTDIPAFYSEWFMHRVRAGYCKVRHPFSKKEILVSLKPEDVVGIVFWTKNFEPTLKYLDELERRGFFYLIHYTITGLGNNFEPRVPALEQSLDLFRGLSERIGNERMLWRFDPIVITEKVGAAETLERFDSIASKLHGHARRVYFSFMQDYARVTSRMKSYAQTTRDRVLDSDAKEKLMLSQRLTDLAHAKGLSIHACCQPDLVGFGIEPAHCIDAALMARLTGKIVAGKPAPTRKSCGCDFSVDLGAYDSCPHLCWYCYANSHPAPVGRNFSAHRIKGEFLVE